MKKYLSISVFLMIGASLMAQVFSSSNLPLVLIETNGQLIIDEPKIQVEMSIIYNGDGMRNHIEDSPNEYEGWAGIEIRGSSSQLYDKKSYALETRDEWGENRNVPLFGMPEENDWVLHGPYSDKSLIRNAMAYKIGRSLMDYAPRTRFVELVIDGQYEGVYLFTEKIKRDKNRVDISKLKPKDETGDQLTGGYILKIDKDPEVFGSGFPSQYPPKEGAWQQTFFQYHDPKPSELSAVQTDYIQGFIHDVDDLMASKNYTDSISGYASYIDVGSFVDYFIVNELCKNIDAYRLSTYLYKDRNSVDPRLKMGPIWDFNLAFGNVDYCQGAGVEGWVKDNNGICPDDHWLVHFWWERLWTDQRFRQAIGQRWLQLRQSALVKEVLFHDIDSLSNLLGEAQTRNFERWPVLSQYVWPNWFVGDTYAEEVDYLKTWLEGRIDWIDEQMENIGNPFYDTADYFSPETYPNPFDELLRFKYYAHRFHQIEVNIYNVEGQLLASHRNADQLDGANYLELDTQQLPRGIYFYKFWINGEEKGSGKVIKFP